MRTINLILTTLALCLTSCSSEPLNFNPPPPSVTIQWTDTNTVPALAGFGVDYLYPVTTNYQTSTNWTRLVTVPPTNTVLSATITNALPSPFLLTVFSISTANIYSAPATPIVWSLTNGVPATPTGFGAQ